MTSHHSSLLYMMMTKWFQNFSHRSSPASRLPWHTKLVVRLSKHVITYYTNEPKTLVTKMAFRGFPLAWLIKIYWLCLLGNGNFCVALAASLPPHNIHSSLGFLLSTTMISSHLPQTYIGANYICSSHRSYFYKWHHQWCGASISRVLWYMAICE